MIFTGVCLAIGVVTWVFSAIKFQADMGLMLTFMFLWNMVGNDLAAACPGALPDQTGEAASAGVSRDVAKNRGPWAAF